LPKSALIASSLPIPFFISLAPAWPSLLALLPISSFILILSLIVTFWHFLPVLHLVKQQLGIYHLFS